MKKKTGKTSKKEIVGTPQEITSIKGGNECFYATIEEMVAVMKDNVDTYSEKIDFTADSELAGLKDFIHEVTLLEADMINDKLTAELAGQFDGKLKGVYDSHESLKFISDVKSAHTLSKEKQIEFIERIWASIGDVIKTVSDKNPRPAYFAGDFNRFAQYFRQEVKWPLIYEKHDICYPTDMNTAIFSFDELIKDSNCENLTFIRPPVLKNEFNIDDDEFVDKGGVAVAFWAKVSLALVADGPIIIFSINKDNNIIKLTLEEAPDQVSVNMKFCVADICHTVNNSSPCSDMTFNIVSIQKEVENYTVDFVTKSWNLNSRKAYTTKVPPNFVENSKVELLNKKSVDPHNIIYLTSFCYNPEESEPTMRKELEIVSQMTDDEWKETLAKVNEVCDNPPPDCDYANEDGSCEVCDEEALTYYDECVKECPEKTFLDEEWKECVDCHHTCAKCDNADTCKDCPPGQYLLLGLCVEECPLDKTPREDGDPDVDCLICQPCTGGCAECDGDDCKSCKDDILLDGKCEETCPEGMFASPPMDPKECKKCDETCKTCKEEGKCIECKDGLFMDADSKTCDETCKDGTYPDPETKKCEECEKNCELCNNSEDCTKCDKGYDLHNKDCVTDCPTGTVSQDGICTPCEENCDTCKATKPDQCTDCSEGFLLVEGDCVETCPEGFMENPEDEKCEKCIDNCKTCPEADSCTDCKAPFLLKDGECVEKCGKGYSKNDEGTCVKCDDNCKKCDPNKTDSCTKCKGDDFLYKEKCVDPCPNGTFELAKECKDCQDDCATCNNSETCETCPEGKIKDEGRCVENCPPGKTEKDGKCEPCVKNNCLKCDTDITVCEDCAEDKLLHNGECVDTCPEGHFENGENCEACELNCKICTNEDTCTKCIKETKDGEKLFLEDGDCVTKCDDGSSPNNENKCEECKEPSCLQCNQDDDTCTKCPIEMPILHNEKCIEKCPEGTVKDSVEDICIPCTPPCKTCENTPDNCKDCIEGYSLMENEDGVDTCVNGCPSGFENINEVCEPCTDKNCDTCVAEADKLDECLSCKETHVLLGEKCVPECPVDMVEVNGKCEECPDNCERCDKQDACKKCDEGFFLKNEKCVKDCGDGFTEDTEERKCKECDGCVECEASETSVCTKCKEDEVLDDGECKEQCPAGKMENEDKECDECTVDDCVKCSVDKEICEECKNGQILYQNECIEECPEKTRMTVKDNLKTCESCSSTKAGEETHCLECPDNKDVCEKCEEKTGDMEHFLDLTDNKCHWGCKDGTYLKEGTNECHPCEKNCEKCKDALKCEECKPEFVLQKDQRCHSECPCGQVEVDGECEYCGLNCLECPADNRETCKKCKEGLVIDTNGKCTEKCKDADHFKNLATGKCEPCSHNCAKCESKEKCDECKEGFLHEGKCADNCPDTLVENNEKKCVPCETSTDCKKCKKDNLEECIECFDEEDVIFNGKCKEQCPDGFMENTSKECDKCTVEGCKVCDPVNECDECNSPLVLKDNKCVEECGENMVEVDGECHKCDDSKCDVCNTDKECEVCQEGTYLKEENGEIKCVEDCGNGEFPKEGKCEECKEGCDECTTANDCKKCESPLVLQGNECKEKCKETMVEVDGKCEPCGPGCKSCSAENTEVCDECLPPKVLQGTVCKKHCDEGFVEKDDNKGECTPCQSNCLKCCSETEKCDLCDGTTVVSVDGSECIDECKDGEVEINGKCTECTVENCKECTSTDKKCKECEVDMVLLTLPNGDDSCKEKCPDGQFAVDGKCQKCDASCTLCVDETGNCTDCKEGFFLHEGKECKPECTEGQAKDANGDCKDCAVDECQVCPADNLETCDQCKPPKKLLENNECVEVCPLGTFMSPDEKECLKCNDDCNICPDTSSCEECKEPKVLQGSVCQEKCNSGYVNVDGKCEKCEDIGCRICDVNNLEKCKECKDTYFLLTTETEKICVKDCGDGKFEKENGPGDVCDDCKSGCQECKNKATCDECKEGLVLKDNECVEDCGEGYVQDGKECKKCDSNDCKECLVEDLSICEECKDGFFLKDGKCKEECGINMFENEDTKTCDKCLDPNCKDCSDNKTCDKCKGDMVLLNDVECRDECPLGMVPNDNKECEQCDQIECGVCKKDNLEVCEECQSGFLDEDGKCVDDCGDKFFENNETKECDPCETKCTECTNDSDCTKCTAPFMLDNGDCKSSCPPGKTEINGECVKCEIENCIECNSGVDSCDICKTPEVLLPGQERIDDMPATDDECVKECPEGTFNNNGTCEKCEKDCLECTDKNTCTRCNENTALNNENCVEECPFKKYEEMTDEEKKSKECKVCSEEGCDKCPEDKCNKCEEGLFLINEKCLPKCPATTFENMEEGTCCECEEGCYKCSDEETCEKCKEPLLLLNADCIEQCPDGYTKKSGKCAPCGDSCTKCSSADPEKCSDCVEGSKLYEEKCIPKCPKGTFMTIRDGVEVCEDCKPECAECESIGVCTKCNGELVLQEGDCKNECDPGFANDNGKCKPCSDPDCEKCKPQKLDECLKCKKDNEFLLEGKCVENCGKGKFENSETGTCDDCATNCEECSNKTDCIKCEEEMFFVEDTEVCEPCADDKVMIGENCYECKVPDCDKCVETSDDVCKECGNDTSLLDGKCVEICPKEMFEDQKECKECEENCEECDSAEDCTKCVKDTILYKGDCVQTCPEGTTEKENADGSKVCIDCTDKTNCLKCKSEDPSECTDCKSNFLLHDGKCTQECPDGHYADDEGKCVKCSENCVSCDKDTCNVCKDNYYLKDGECTNDCGDGYRDENGKCIKCTEDCKECSAEKCDVCVDGKVLLDGECKEQCSEDTYEEDGECKDCMAGCEICKTKEVCDKCTEEMAINENGKCVKDCGEGMTSVNGHCTSCKDEVNCKNCEKESPGTCINCKNDKVLFEDECKEECEDGFVEVMKDGKKVCEKCPSTCKNCTANKETCTECDDPLVLYEGDCINQCPDGTMKVGEKCEPCKLDNCKVCVASDQETSDAKCKKCELPSVLMGDECISECPEGFFTVFTSNNEGGECQECSKGCKNCKEDGICKECKKGYFFDAENNQCLQYCPSDQYGDCDDYKCKDCNIACKSCVGDSNSDCLECAADYMSTNGKCVHKDNCLEGTYPDMEEGKCKPCNQKHCEACSGPEKCDRCSKNNALKDGECKEFSTSRSIIKGTLLLTPYSPGYEQKINYTFADDLEGIGVKSSDLSFCFYLRSLGVTENLNKSYDSSEIFRIVTPENNLEIKFIVNRLQNKKNQCMIRLRKGEEIHEVVLEDVDCSDRALFKYTLFNASIYETGNGKTKIDVSAFDNKAYIFDRYSAEITTPIGPLIEMESYVQFLGDAGSNGYQISKFNVGDFVFSNDILGKFAQSQPTKYSWICINPNECESGLIPLLKGFGDLNAEFLLSDKLNVNSLMATNNTYGLKFYIFFTYIPEKNVNIAEIFYGYDDYTVKKTTALKLVVNSEYDVATLDGNTVYLAKSVVFKAQKWYLVSVGVKSTDDGVEFTTIVEDGKKNRITYEVLKDPSRIEDTTKLYIDASVALGSGSTTGQIYNVGVVLNDLDSFELKSIPSIMQENTCDNFALSFECSECAEFHEKNEDGVCIDKTMENGQELFKLFSIYNSKIREFCIPTEFEDKDWTIEFYMRKLVHSIYTENNAPNNLISFRASDGIYKLVTEEILPNYQSKYVFGENNLIVDYSDHIYDFYQVFLIKSGDKIDIHITSKSQLYSGVVYISEVKCLVIGDMFAREIHTEFKQGYIYPKAVTDDDLVEMMKIDLVDTDPTCINADFFTGECIECRGRNNVQDSTKCYHAIYGFKFNYLYGYLKYQSIPKISNYVFEIINENPENVNSQSYGIFGFVRFLSVPQLTDKTYAIYNLVKIRNNPHLQFFKNDPSNNLISLMSEIKDGVGRYYWIVNTAVGVVEEDIPCPVIPGQWLLIGAAIDVASKKFKYNVQCGDNFENKYSNEVTLPGYPEKLQAVGQLISFSVLSDPQEKLSVPNGESVHLYAIPNLQDYGRVFQIFEGNHFKPKPAEPLENCMIALNDANTNESTCIECDKGFIFKSTECERTDLAIADENIRYKVLTDRVVIREETVELFDSVVTNVNDLSVNLSFYFRINFTEKEAEHEILKAGDLGVNIYFMDYYAFIKLTYEDNYHLMGPIDTDKLFGFCSLSISFTLTKIGIFLKHSGISHSSISESANITGAITIPETATIYNADNFCQIYGLHIIDKNYGYPVIPEPLDLDCGVDCTECHRYVCTASAFGIEDGKVALNDVSLRNTELVSGNLPKVYNLVDFFPEEKILRSQTFSFRTTFAPSGLKEATIPGGYFTIFKINLSEDNNITLRVNANNLKDFSLTYRNYYTNIKLPAPPIDIFSLEKDPQNTVLAIILSVDSGKINLIVYDSQINYKLVRIDVQGQLDYLTRNATIEIGQDINSEGSLAFYKSAKLSYDRAIKLANFLGVCYKMLGRNQLACDTTNADNGQCKKCKTGYQLISDVEGDTSCALDGTVYASQTNVIKYTNHAHPLIYEYDLSSVDKLEKLTFMDNIKVPQGYTDYIGLIKIEAADGTRLFSVYSHGLNIRAVNKVSGKSSILNDVLLNEDRSTYLTITVLINFSTGYSKVQTYCKSSGRIFMAESKGNATDKTFKNIKIQIGFHDVAMNTVERFSFKTGAAVLYLNNVLSTTNIEELSYNQNSCTEPCKATCENGSICPAGKEFKEDIKLFPIVPHSGERLFSSLKDYQTDFKSTAEFLNYNLRIKFTSEKYKSFINDSSNVNSVVVFLLTNHVKQEYIPMTRDVLLPDSLQESNSFAITFGDGSLLLNLFSGPEGRRYNLLPEGVSGFDFNYFDLQFLINSEESTISVNVQADDILFEFNVNLGRNNWEIQGVNRETLIYANSGVDSASIGLDKDPANAFGVYNADVTPKQDNHGLENCKIAKFSSADKTCKLCDEGFNLASNLGVCSASTNSGTESQTGGD